MNANIKCKMYMRFILRAIGATCTCIAVELPTRWSVTNDYRSGPCSSSTSSIRPDSALSAESLPHGTVCSDLMPVADLDALLEFDPVSRQQRHS